MDAFVSTPFIQQRAAKAFPLHATSNDENDEADRLKAQAEALREQIRKMEKVLPQDRRQSSPPPPSSTPKNTPTKPTSLLDNQRVLVVGSNGRLGSMVCRYLLRQHPELKEVIACVHVVGENSETSRGYGRLAYEVGKTSFVALQ